MDIRKIKNFVIIFAIFVFYSFDGNAYGISRTSVELNMQLPKAFHETNFDSDYYVSVNRNDYAIKGSSFIFQDYTYIPVRDIAEIFHINVSYNELDRAILLSDNEKEIIITPKIYLYDEYGGAMIKNGNETVINQGVDYILVNNRSYVPLQFIIEAFGFAVEYENSNKQITIVGDYPSNIGANHFSNEQQAIIDAISEYEAKSMLSVKGTVDYFGENKHIEANIKRENVNNCIVETLEVKENNEKQYKGIYKVGETGTSVKVTEIFSNGLDEIINLSPFAGRHPYVEFAKFKLCGLNKYRNMIIEKDRETGQIVTYKITDIDGEKLGIFVSIQKSSGSLVHYMEITDFGQKDLSII